MSARAERSRPRKDRRHGDVIEKNLTVRAIFMGGPGPVLGEVRNMPRDERVVVVLVASPSDLEAERNRLEEIIREMNLTWSRTLGVRLELVRWETHGYPGMGADPQDVLNRELPDPDIFIGLMWGRYGTPTGRAGSGTEEEFRRALSRYQDDAESVRIMFYFKDAPLNPSVIDPEQLARVQSFRQSLGPEGALYWKFVSLEEFEQLLRIHLARQIQEYVSKVSLSAPAAQPATRDAGLDADEEEPGLLDYLDLVEEDFGTLSEITERITMENASLGSKLEERVREVSAATAAGQRQLGRREARALVDRAAGDMMQYAARMKAEIPLFRELLRKGADAAGHAALLSAGMAFQDRQQVSDTRAALASFCDTLGGVHGSLDQLMSAVRGVPRLTADLNKSKREVVTVLQDVQDSIAEGRRVVTETVKALDALLGASGRTT